MGPSIGEEGVLSDWLSSNEPRAVSQELGAGHGLVRSIRSINRPQAHFARRSVWRSAIALALQLHKSAIRAIVSHSDRVWRVQSIKRKERTYGDPVYGKWESGTGRRFGAEERLKTLLRTFKKLGAPCQADLVKTSDGEHCQGEFDH